MNDDDFRDISFHRRIDREVARRELRYWRASLGEASLLTAEDVARALPGRAEVIRRWLANVPRYVLPNGQEVFRWGEVLRHLERVA